MADAQGVVSFDQIRGAIENACERTLQGEVELINVPGASILAEFRKSVDGRHYVAYDVLIGATRFPVSTLSSAVDKLCELYPVSKLASLAKE